jgi:hypothetical protein
MNPADLLQVTTHDSRDCLLFLLRRATNASEAPKRVMDLCWTLFWFFVLALAMRNLDNDPTA